MKKLIVLVFALSFFGSTFAQEKAYFSLGVGAGIGTARTYDLYQGSYKVHPVGLGKGIDFNLRGGFFINEFMALELGVGYRMGLSTKLDVETTSGTKSTHSSGTIKFKSNMLYVTPAVMISPDLGGETVRPYARLGVIIGILPSIVQNIDVTDTYSGNTVATLKYSGGVSIGGSFALGCDFSLSEMLAIYAEVYYDALSYAPSKGKLTKCEVDGKDILGDLTTNDKEVKFVKDLTGYTPVDSEPDQQLKNSYPLNSLGLNIGLKIKLQ